MNRRLAEIETLTGMVLDAELSKLRALSEEVARRRATLDSLAAARRARAAEVHAGEGAADLAWITGQDARWLDWLAGESARATAELAQAAAQREAQRVAASRAFGRVEAVSDLRRHEATIARLTASRRLSMNG